VDVCPKRVLSVSEAGRKLGLRNVSECTVCRDCVDVCPKSPPAITIAWDKDVFILDIESTGAIPIERLVHEAVKILDRKFESFIEELSVKKDETTQIAES
jgi:formate hydrogenlyase subunit 6/NADH:ubiquinone oxidoreductase subunit I